MLKRLLSKGVVLGVISMLIVGAFMFNARGITAPTANLSDSNYMLRPAAASSHIASVVLGMGFEGLNSALTEGGAKGLEKAIADLALAKADDSLKEELTKENISVIEKDGKTFIVCLIGNGWLIELSKGSELKTTPFASAKQKDEFMLGAQRTWVSMMGSRTPREIHEAQIAADAYIGQAGKEGRIFVENGLDEQVKKYAKANGLNADAQALLLKRLNAAIAFRNNAINGLTQDDSNEFTNQNNPDSIYWLPISQIKRDLSDDLAIRKAIIFDAKDGVAFSLLGDLSALKYLTVTASSGAGYVYDKKYKGDFPRSIYEVLGMTESYMEMVNAGDQDALKAYKAKVLLHEYVVVNSQSKTLRKERPAVTNLINKYDRIAITNWIEREAKKVEAIEAKKTIAEATSANIGKFVKGGVIPAELIDTANAELQKLVTLGLLTDYRVINKDGKVSILTTRKNSKAVEDDAQIPSAIQDVYLQILIKAQEKGIYTGENLADKSYRQQAEALELSASLPTLTYLKPEGWANIFSIRTELKIPEGQPIEVLNDLFNTAVGSLAAPSTPTGWTGANESAQKFIKSSLGLQSSGLSHKLNEDVFSAAKDITNQKVVLINASVLRSDPSLILTQQSINKQINQRLGVLGSTVNIKANAFRFVLIPDASELKTPKDIENLFAAIAKETKNGAVADKDMFAAIPTQGEMFEGKINNAADLLKQLERIGIKRESIAGLVGPNEWTSAIKAQKGISKDTISANTDAQENQIAFAGNALFGVVEAIASADKKLPSEIAGKLGLTIEGMNIALTPTAVNGKIQDFITAYRETVKAI